jgi:GNAT superfamily N-acetyltransferase
LKALANKFYRSHRSPMRAHHEDQVWVIQTSEIVAALCLRPVATGQWLTGLFVAPERRRQGLARQLVEQALQRSAEPVWLFCHPQRGAFYLQLGFQACAQLPHELGERLARYQRSKPLIALVRAASPLPSEDAKSNPPQPACAQTIKPTGSGDRRR